MDSGSGNENSKERRGTNKKHPVLCYESITVLVFCLNQYKGHTVNFILFNKRVNKH